MSAVPVRTDLDRAPPRVAQSVPPSPQAVLDAVRGLAPSVKSAAEEIERTRELPRPLFEALADAGLFHLLVPHQLGGAELPLPAYVEALEVLGQADASTAWCINQGGVFATHAVCVSPELAHEIWFAQPRSVVANTPTPTATAVAVEGGYLVTGRQGYSTGSRHANWIAARGMVLEENRPDAKPRQVAGPQGSRPDMRFFMIPVDEVRLLDTWHTRGLRGTGTHHFEMRELFVPEHRTFFPFAPARPEYGPLYRLPRTQLFATGDAIIALGVARSAVDHFVELAGQKTPTYRTDLVKDQQYVQIRLGEAEARLRAGRALLYEQVREAWAALEQGHRAAREAGRPPGPLPLERRIGLRTATTFALRTGAQVVDTLYNLAGGTVVLESHPLQRLFQDAHVITQHVQAREQHYELTGRWLLGLDPDSQYV
jgi:indole-3-acetate monooxygenase